MTGPVIELRGVRGAKLTRITPVQVPANAPEPQPADLNARIVAIYGKLLGADVQAADLVERRDANGTLDLNAVRAVFEAANLTVSITRVTPPPAEAWPALAELDTGELCLVLAQEDDTLIICDLDDPDQRGEVPLETFLPRFTGTLLRARATPAELTRRHARAGQKPHWFWGELTKYRRIIGEVALGSFVANVLAVAVALFSLQVYDRVIPHQSVETLWVLAIGAGLAMLLEAFLRIARARLMDGAGRRIELRVQDFLMARLLGMQSDPNRPPSQTFAAMRDFSQIREFFTASTIGTLTDLPFIVLFLALVASIGGNVVWVLFAGGILMVLPSFFLQKKMMKLTLATQGAHTKSSRLLQEAIYEADTIKAHRAEDSFRRNWSELTAVSSLATSEQRKLASTLTYWSQGVQQATYVAAVVVGTFMVFQGQFTIGTIIAVGILTSRTLGPLTGLAGMLARWSNVKAALDALDQIVDAEQDTDADRTYLRRETLEGRFDLRELGFAYDAEGARCLDIPALTIQPGQKIAVLGANGSGKSTLLKLLSGLNRPTTGRVLVDGVDMGQILARDLRRNIGYLSQEVRLFAGTLRDNLNLSGIARDDARLFAALDFAGLGAHVRNHPKGLDLEILDGGAGLSIGQRQSIGWARLWLQDPAVCLLDEPTAALDHTLEADLVARLQDWLAGRTGIIATHRMPILGLTDRVMVLNGGRLVVDGPRDEVLAHMAERKAG